MVAEAVVAVAAEDLAIAIDLPHEEDLEVLHDTTVTVVHDHAVDKFSKTAMFSLIFAKIEFFRFSFSPSSVKFRVVSRFRIVSDLPHGGAILAPKKKLETYFMHFVISLFTATTIDPKIIKKINKHLFQFSTRTL